MDNGPNKRLKIDKKENVSQERSPTVNIYLLVYYYIVF